MLVLTQYLASGSSDLPGLGTSSVSNASSTDAAAARVRERTLILRVRESDERAFGTLMDLHGNRMVRLAFHFLGSHDAAKDIAQSVFVHVWNHRADLDPDRALQPYLLRATRNRALDEQKAGKVRARHYDQVHGEALAGSIQTSVPSPECAVLTTAVVQAALAQLPERRQLALRLLFEEDYTVAEIADLLGASLQATDRLLRRALGDLREILLMSK